MWLWLKLGDRLERALPLAVFAIGSALALVGGAWRQQDTQAQARAAFERSVERVSDDVQHRIRQPIFALKGAGGLYAASPRVSRAAFSAFVETRDLALEFPGVRGVGFIQRVQRDGLQTFVASERADDAPQFTVRQLADAGHDDLYVIKYIEPLLPNLSAVGLDVGSEPARREAAERAVLSGEPTLSAAITLVQDQNHGPGFLLYLAVYRRGADPVTLQQRRSALVGLLYAPIVAGELLSDIHKIAAGDLEFDLVDAAAGPASRSLIFSSSADPAASTARSASAAPMDRAKGRFATTRTVALPGRALTLHARSTPQFDAALAFWPTWLVAGSGVLISALLAMLLRQQGTGRRRAEALAQAMTADLDRLAQVARHSSNAVSITDRDLRIVWINEGFTRITGHAPDQALSQTPGQLLGSDKADPAVLRVLADAVAAGRGCRIEILNRARDGHEFWFDTEIQPLHDGNGLLTGFMQIGSDVTERHVARARLEAAQRDTEALLRTIDLHAIVSVADRSGQIIQANDAFCQISGYHRDELLGQDHRLLNSGVQPPGFWVDMWRSISNGTPWRGEVCNRAKDGSLYWVDSVIAPFVGADGHIEKYISIRNDITVSKTAARDLARQRLALANILEGTNVGTWEWNLATDALVFNERWAQMLGHTLAELGPTAMATWRERSHPDDITRTETMLKQHFRDELPALECENRVRHRDGHWVWVLTRGKVFSRATDGRPRWMAGTHMDISARKQAEAALRASQAMLERTGRIAGVGGWSMDLAGQTLHWADQTCRIHDLEPGHQPTLDEALRYYAPEARIVIQRAVDEAMANGKSFDLELRLITASGRELWVRAVGEVEFVDGRPGRLEGTFEDVTARHVMAARLQHSHQVMASVIENLPCGLSVFDAELNLVAANGEFRRLLDFPATLFETTPTRFEDIVRFNAARGEYGSDNVEAAVQAVVERARLPSVAHQFERTGPDGAPLEVRGGPMPGGGFVTTYTDVSARKRAEAEVLRSSQLMRGAIDAIDEAFVLFDPEDRLVFCNDKYRQMFPETAELFVPGAAYEDLIRQSALRGQRPAAAGRIEEWVAERLAQRSTADGAVVQRLSNGRTIRIVDRRMPDGHIVGFRIDITELIASTEAAQKASVAKSQFLANMSHEIRTPMNAILGMLALLRKTELTARQADYAVKTEGAARSLLGLLNDILDFSKVEAGKMTLDAHPFRIDQLLRDLSVIVSANVGSKPVEVLFDIDADLPRQLVGDAMRLQQVLTNLTGNAIKFTARGEVVLSIRVLGQDSASVTVEVAVRDTGIGIAPENHARIFSGFTQAEASTTRRFGGTGLGVAISQRMVALMGGELRLDSVLGQGSRFHFTITLPLVSDAVQDRAASRPASGISLRALVVDDNPTARDVLQRMGDALGWTISLADSGEAALDLLQTQAALGIAFDAVFVDWQMPGLDGWATSQRIRALALDSATPVIVMVTAHGREMLAQRSATEQALLDGFLVKPVTPSMLFDAIADAGRTRGPAGPARTLVAAGAPRLAGLRLLVAEDNFNNQQVARELLEDEGASVQIANNGKEAVEAVAAADPPFDVVLMDLQMPVMDGFSATRSIREDLALRTLPIVAMTANAMASDREACLAAGMNEHVGKPFDLNHLVEVLLRQAKRATAPLDNVTPPHKALPLPAAVQVAAAAAQVQIEAAVARLGGKVEVYRHMLQRFIDDLARLPSELHNLAQAADLAGAARALHTVKGVAATLGADVVAAAAAQGEKALLAGATPAAAQLVLTSASTAIDAAGSALHALLQTLRPAEAPCSTGPKPEIDRPALRQHLGDLAQLLRDSDMGAMQALTGMKAQFSGAMGPRFDALDAAVAGLDFEAALRHCTQQLEELSS